MLNLGLFEVSGVQRSVIGMALPDDTDSGRASNKMNSQICV
jgi:hypothetical protein